MALVVAEDELISENAWVLCEYWSGEQSLPQRTTSTALYEEQKLKNLLPHCGVDRISVLLFFSFLDGTWQMYPVPVPVSTAARYLTHSARAAPR